MNETCHQKKRYFIAIVLHSARQRPRGDRLPRAFTAVAIVAMVGLFYTQQATSLSAGRQNPPVPQSPQLPTFRTETHFVRVDAYPSRDGHIVEGLTASDFEVFEDCPSPKSVRSCAGSSATPWST
jgi:hypothetical protein